MNIDKLKRDTDRLIQESDKLKRESKQVLDSITFSVQEQELIHRVLFSVFTQFKNKKDKEIAERIIEKTEWCK